MTNNNTVSARIRAVTAACNAHDFDALALNLAEGASLKRGDGSSFDGKDSVREALRGFLASCPDANLRLLRTQALGADVAVAEWALDGTQPSTGKVVEVLASALVFLNSAGLIERFELRADAAAFLTPAEPSRQLDPARVSKMAESYTAAWCSGDSAAVGAHYAPHGWIRINATPAHIGQEGVAAMAAGFMEAFPGMILTLDDLHVADETAVFSWTLHGNNTGPGGIGNKVVISGYEVWQLDEDYKVAKSHGYYDSAAYAHQVEFGV